MRIAQWRQRVQRDGHGWYTGQDAYWGPWCRLLVLPPVEQREAEQDNGACMEGEGDNLPESVSQAKGCRRSRSSLALPTGNVIHRRSPRRRAAARLGAGQPNRRHWNFLPLTTSALRNTICALFHTASLPSLEIHTSHLT